MSDPSSPSVVKYPARRRRLTHQERHFTRQALNELYRVRLGLWIVGFNAWRRRGNKPVQAQMSGAPIKDLLNAVNRARRWVPRDTSLIEALAAQRLLAQHGYQSTVHIGIAKEGVSPVAHAWLSYQGHVVVGRIPNLSDYTAIPFKRGYQ